MMNISIQKPDVRTISRSDLVDIRQVNIDPSLSKQDRIKSFVSQIRNPYCYLDGDVVVGVSYADTEISLEDRLKSYACNLA
ncbi:MAG: hypothetical protein IJE08_02230 [Clostridia bacterium]|nr:hypothetical protein [Clostridia bacterium]